MGASLTGVSEPTGLRASTHLYQWRVELYGVTDDWMVPVASSGEWNGFGFQVNNKEVRLGRVICAECTKPSIGSTDNEHIYLV